MCGMRRARRGSHLHPWVEATSVGIVRPGRRKTHPRVDVAAPRGSYLRATHRQGRDTHDKERDDHQSQHPSHHGNAARRGRRAARAQRDSALQARGRRLEVGRRGRRVAGLHRCLDRPDRPRGRHPRAAAPPLRRPRGGAGRHDRQGGQGPPAGALGRGRADRGDGRRPGRDRHRSCVERGGRPSVPRDRAASHADGALRLPAAGVGHLRPPGRAPADQGHPRTRQSASDNRRRPRLHGGARPHRACDRVPRLGVDAG